MSAKQLTNQPDNSPANGDCRPASCYAVGDRVRMLETITRPPSEELPAQHFCDKGEVLIVRKVGGFWPVNVSHEHINDRSFGVTLDQIEKASLSFIQS